MAGNVWKWTSDWYVSHLDESANKAITCCKTSINPRVTSFDYSYDPRQLQFNIPRKVVKSGSHICAPNYCLRYRPSGSTTTNDRYGDESYWVYAHYKDHHIVTHKANLL
ncbi:MAG TPA: SUMF1/EgtB/PvdO family nonheme iron enzyme [Nitrososphaeraceae archaeon]